MLYKNVKDKEKQLIFYLKNNPTATYQQIKEVVQYIKTNPGCTIKEIQESTRVSIPKVFGNITEAYKKAEMIYPRFPKIKNKFVKMSIINFVKTNPLATSVEINQKFGISMHKYFKNMKELSREAEIKHLSGHKKQLMKKQNKVIGYIKENPNSTQSEINKACNTHVQEIFTNGIKTAYEKAEIVYPKDRRKKYGAANKHIKNRALAFEDEITTMFKNLGKIKKHFRTGGGIADAIATINNKKYIIEIKDYQSKPVSYSEIKQLNKYISNTPNCNDGFLVCRTKSKKDKFYIGKNKISVITKKDLLEGGVV